MSARCWQNVGKRNSGSSGTTGTAASGRSVADVSKMLTRCCSTLAERWQKCRQHGNFGKICKACCAAEQEAPGTCLARGRLRRTGRFEGTGADCGVGGLCPCGMAPGGAMAHGDERGGGTMAHCQCAPHEYSGATPPSHQSARGKRDLRRFPDRVCQHGTHAHR
eukprot:gene9670-biopygen5522